MLLLISQSSHSPGPDDGRGRRRSSSNASTGSYFSFGEGNPLQFSATHQSQTIPQYQPSRSSHVADGTPIVHGGATSPTYSRLSAYTSNSAFTAPIQQQLPQSFQQLPVQSFPLVPLPQAIGQTQIIWNSSLWSTPQPQTQNLIPLLSSGPQIVDDGQVNVNQPLPMIQLSSPQAVCALAPPTTIPGLTLAQSLGVPPPTSISPTSQLGEVVQDDQLNKDGSGGVLPQNLRGDPFRSAKVKTEMCRDYNKPGGCRFGDKCNYAHGVHQLKNQKLMDLAAAGLVDIEVYRTHVCVPWVATGAW